MEAVVTDCAVGIKRHSGPREELRPLFEMAEDSARELDSYLDAGVVLVAACGEEIVGHLQLTDTPIADEIEVKNLAVRPAHRRRGIGRALIAAALELAARDARGRVRVATAAADIENLRFYQRLGFRMRSIDRDAFTPATGYACDLKVHGIQLRDRVWLDIPVLR
jgi:ribosomal protein S18 acetylase RimI-like enzyme